MRREPCLHALRLVGREVITNEMDRASFRLRCHLVVEEAHERGTGVPLGGHALDTAGADLQLARQTLRQSGHLITNLTLVSGSEVRADSHELRFG